MKHIKSLFGAAFMLFINVAYAQTAATHVAAVSGSG